jgi:hypothetical protein
VIVFNGKLTIFDEFQADRNLPKFKDEKAMIGTVLRAIASSQGRELDDNELEYTSNPMRISLSAMPDSNLVLTEAPPSFWSKLAFWKPKPKTQPEPTMSVEEFFSHIKNSASELNVVKERAAGYERAMVNARRTGQKALFEQLRDGLAAYKAETQLVAMGLTKFIEEETIVRFVEQTKRGLRLDFVANFARQIPEDVIAKKDRADELGIFDNYAVLHYDPQGKAYAETEAEKEAKKDPILFGLMKGKRVLYFVGDWIDEFCDLTLDQFADVMGRDAVHDLKALPAPYREAP